MRVAFFSDVHSNLPALEAVLDDIAAAGVDARYTLGDLVGYARSVQFRRVAYDVEQTAQAILASDLPDEFATEVREARGLQVAPASVAR